MPIDTVVLSDDPQQSTVRETLTDETGAVVCVTIRSTPKPGTPGANELALRDKAQQALTANAAYLAVASPTAAQNTAQIQRLTRECNALIRLLIGRLDDTAGT